MADEGVFMELQADAVAAELAHHREALRMRVFMHRSTHIAEQAPRLHRGKTRFQSLFGLLH